ncbi:MAG TPA: M15 family metallopeptidase [Acidimicrobiales bacterium]|nr:M15 family metallopeptidase [Acidimicrobiales bacterium]
MSDISLSATIPRVRLIRCALSASILAGSLFIAGVANASNGGLPAFTSSVASVNAAQLGKTWRPGCPVGPSQLRLLHLRYLGFDGRSRNGTMVVNATVATSVVKVFATLYEKRFPIHLMAPESHFQGKDPASMAADNTSDFNCRYAVVTGPKQWSVHAYGEAIDVNPVQNPYVFNGVAQPVAGKAYINRSDVRPGMAELGGALNDAFASVGWFWGGRWSASPDYQHFSLTGG